MFDFVKLGLSDSETVKRLMNDPGISFVGGFYLSTGELLEKFEANYKGLKITLYQSNRITIEGSLHMFYNSLYSDVIHNHNQFSLSMVKAAVGALTSLLDINANLISIHNLEFGHNVRMGDDICIKKKLQNFIVFKNQHPFSIIRFRDGGCMVEYSSSQACIKFYDKGTQYKLPENILRVEKRVKVMQNQFDRIIHLSDLLLREFWLECQGELLKARQRCLYIEKPKKVSLQSKEANLFNNCRTPSFWEDLTPRERYYYSKEKLPALLEKHSLDLFKRSLVKYLMECFDGLIST
jgi:hypothetical protein